MIPGMMKDKNYGEGGLNPWSVGDIYPLVIARVEKYERVCRRVSFDDNSMEYRLELESKSWNVLNADDDMAGFASYNDAYAAAKGYLAAKAAAKPVLSPFNPAAYDVELAEDMIEDEYMPCGIVTPLDPFIAAMKADAERMSLPEPGYGNKFCGGA